ncbi:MAG: hypothetical protein ACI4KI_07395 [Candidatus Fimenecus sp.]
MNTMPLIKMLFGIALILCGVVLGVCQGLYLALAFAAVGLFVCIYALIGAMPDDKPPKKKEDQDSDKKE